MAQKKPLIIDSANQVRQITTDDVIASVALGTGTADSTTFLNGAGAWAVPPASPASNGLPAGGTTGQVLSKINGTDYNVTWTSSAGGGAVGGGGDAVFYENDAVVTTDYTITTGKNAMSAGPITVNEGVTVTVPSGSVWSIV